jgi:hypothetical protein
LPLNGHQPAPDHGVKRNRANARLAQKVLEGRHVMGLDVDQKVIGGPRRQPLLPGPQQIDAHHRQQEQGQDAQTQAGDMEDGPA